MKIVQFSPKPALIADVTNALKVLENVRKIERSKMEGGGCDTEH
jgi:hypothetical protein